MSDATIRIRPNGPLKVTGSFTLQDVDGTPYETGESVALCRCGHSADKPFCDGAHNAAGFESEPHVGA